MSSRHHLVLDAVLGALRPLVGLLVRKGVGYPALAAALKPLFVDAAERELIRQGMKRTDSAVTLMSGVHRRDVRQLRSPPSPATVSVPAAPPGPTGEVVARWLGDARWQDAQGQPRPLARHGADDSFDALVHSVSLDIRPSAMLDELLRQGVVRDTEAGLAIDPAGFAPRQDEAQMCALLHANLHDHAATAAANLSGERNLLEQALYVDEITDTSAHALEAAARQSWQRTLHELLPLAQARHTADAETALASSRTRRARIGFYVYTTEEPTAPPPPPERP